MSQQPGVKFIYLACTDLSAIRHFYSDLLGLKEIYFAPGPEGSVAYDCDGLQFGFWAHADAVVAPAGWAFQPGWQGGTLPIASWSVVLTDDHYRAVIARLQAANVESFTPQPTWHYYWSFPVKDPMGNTVEIVYPPDEEPDNLTWQA